MKTKNKFFANSRILPVSIIIFILCSVVFVFFAVFEGFDENIYLTLAIIVILAVLPFLLLVMGITVGCIMIEISEEGISTELYGKKLKFFKWEEITEVKATTPDRDAHSEIEFYKNKDTNARRRKAEKISFTYYCLDLSKEALIKRYAPEDIIEKLNFSTKQ